MRPKTKLSYVVAFCVVIVAFLYFQTPESGDGDGAEGNEKVPELHNDAQTQQLVFGVYSADKPSSVYEQFKPVLDTIANAMTEKTGQTYIIKPRIFKTYEEGRTALVEGRVDFARFGPASYILAEQKNPRLRLLGMELKKGERQFRGLIVVRRDSVFQELKDLKGASFAFGDRTSTIGRFLAQSELLSVGIKASDLKKFRYLGRHDLVFKSVQLGDSDAGSLKESTFKKMNKKNELRVLHRFWNVTKPWIASSDLSPEIVAQLTNVLLSIDGKSTLKSLKASGFAAASPEDYNTIRESMALSRAFGVESK